MPSGVGDDYSNAVPHDTAKAEALKIAGNNLYLNGKFREAYGIYTEAIAFNRTNAVLYANRAAASLDLKEFLDAACDARQATKLDPKYTKAWTRLAKAYNGMAQFSASVHAWKSAIECLPTSSLTPEQQQQKQQCHTGHEAAVQQMRAMMIITPENANISTFHPRDNSKLPWGRALELKPEYQKKKMYNSSIWIVLHAYNEFTEGLRIMQRLRRVGDYAMLGTPQAFTFMINAILRDERVFHMDPVDWSTRLNAQIMFEVQLYNGWTDAGPQQVIAEAPVRLRDQGWDAVRRAIRITVRAWILNGYMSNQMAEYDNGVTYLNSAITVLEWGAKAWANVPRDDRGAIFQPTFIRGVKRIYLDAYMVAFKYCPSGSGYTLDHLEKIARELYDEMEVVGPGDARGIIDDLGFVQSFFRTPKGTALAALGFCYWQCALGNGKLTKHNGTVDYWKMSGNAYRRAAEVDDENFLRLWKVYIETVWRCKRPLGEMLPLLKRLRKALPNARYIWGHGPIWPGVIELVTPALEYEEKAIEGIVEGKCTLDTPSPSVGFVGYV